jgi:hypothetical protein
LTAAWPPVPQCRPQRIEARLGKRRFNPKRRILSEADAARCAARLADLARRVRYGGNPNHKRNPGDFALDPPASPRPDKTLCDEDARIFRRSKALALLRAGLAGGLVSAQWLHDDDHGEWPKNVWAVTAASVPVEAILENPALGTYHGYPMPTTDDFRSAVLARWRAASGLRTP